jgi:tetratricopeptide (TPR) repeat protein
MMLENLLSALQPRRARAEACYNRAMDHAAQGEYDLALAEFNQTIRLALASAAAYYGRGRVYLALGAYDQAGADLEMALLLAPAPAGARIYQDRTLARQGHRNHASVEPASEQPSMLTLCPD